MAADQGQCDNEVAEELRVRRVTSPPSGTGLRPPRTAQSPQRHAEIVADASRAAAGWPPPPDYSGPPRRGPRDEHPGPDSDWRTVAGMRRYLPEERHRVDACGVACFANDRNRGTHRSATGASAIKASRAACPGRSPGRGRGRATPSGPGRRALPARAATSGGRPPAVEAQSSIASRRAPRIRDVFTFAATAPHFVAPARAPPRRTPPGSSRPMLAPATPPARRR